MLTTSNYDTLDAWFLRIGITLYGSAASWELSRGLWIRLANCKGFREAVRRHWLYILINNLPLYIVVIFYLALAIENYTGSGKAYIYMIAILASIYTVLETQISFSRLPRALMSNRNWIVLVSLCNVGLLVAILRVMANTIIVVKIFGSDKADIAELESSSWNTAAVAMNMFASAYFAGTEFFVYYLTTNMSRSTSPKVAVIMKLLAHANIFGSLAGLCDIITQYLQLQTTEAIVMAIAVKPLSFYGRVFMLDDEPPAELKHEATIVEKGKSSIPAQFRSIAQAT